MVVYASNTLKGGFGSESVTINLPVAEKVSGYVLNGNMTAWTLYGDTNTMLDSQSLQYSLKSVYTLPSVATTYTSYTLLVQQVSGDASVRILTFKLTNEYNTLIIVPNLTTSVSTDYDVILQDVIRTNELIAPTDTIYASIIYKSSYARQCSVISNIICSNIFYSGPTPWYLFGSKDGGTTWSNLIATNTTISSNNDAYNCFRVLSSTDYGFIITDPYNNVVHANNPTTVRLGGGDYKGKSITDGVHKGEWVEIDFTPTTTYANSYSIAFPSTISFSSHWKVLGYTGTQWNLISEVSNIYSISTSMFVSYPFKWPTSGYIKYRLVFVGMYGSSVATATQFLVYDDMGKRIVPKITSAPTLATYTTIGVPTVTITSSRTLIEFKTPVSVYKFANLSPCTTGTIIAYKDVSMTDSNICVNSARNYVAQSSNTQPFKIFEFTGDYRNSNVYSNVAFIGRVGQLNEVCDINTGISAGPLYGGSNISPLLSPTLTFSLPTSKTVKTYVMVTDNYNGMPVAWKLSGFNTQTSVWTDIDVQSNLYNSGSGSYIVTADTYSTYGIYINEIRCTSERYFKLKVFQLFTSDGSKLIPIIPSTGTVTYSSKQVIQTNIDGIITISASAYSIGSSPDTVYNITDYNPLSFFQSASVYNLSTNQTSTTVGGVSYSGEYIQIKLTYPVIVKKFAFAISGSQPTSPKTFVLAASNDGITWSLLFSQSSGISPPLPKYGTYTRGFTNTTNYIYYRFIVTSIVFGTCFQLSMFTLYSSKGVILPKMTIGGRVITNLYGGSASTPEVISVKTDKFISPSYIYLESASNCLPSNVQIIYNDSVTGQATTLLYYDYFGVSNTLVIPIQGVISNTFSLSVNSTQPNVDGRSAFSLSKYQLLNTNKQNLLANINYATTDTSILKLKDSNVYYVVNSKTNPGGGGVQYITLDAGQTPTNVNGYYINFTGGALTWNIAGSSDGTSWTQLDSRQGIINTNEYKIYLNNPTTFSKFKLTISNTFSGYDSIGVKEFNVINNRNDKITYFGSNVYYSGYNYTKTSSINYIKVYSGEYLIFTYPSPIQYTGLSIVSKYPIREVVLLGRPDSTYDWVYMNTTTDRTITGTFIFSGTTGVDNPIGAFTNIGTIMSRYGTQGWVQIETPYPIKATTYKLTQYNNTRFPYDTVGTIATWYISGSLDGVTYTTLLNGTTSTTLTGTFQTPALYKFYKFGIQSVNSGINFGIGNIELYDVDNTPLFKYNTANPPTDSVVNISTPGVTSIPVPNTPQPLYGQYALVFTKVESSASILDVLLVDFTTPNRIPIIGSTNFTNTFNYLPNIPIGPYPANTPAQYVILKSSEPIKLQSYSFISVKAHDWSLYGSSDSIIWSLINDTQQTDGTLKGGTVDTNVVYPVYKLVINNILTTSDIDGCVEISSFTMNGGNFPRIPLTSDITDFLVTTTPGFINSYANPILTISGIGSNFIHPYINDPTTVVDPFQE
jgi:hypothetical protein